MAFLKRRRFLTWIGMAVTSLTLVIGWQFINLLPAVSDTTLTVYAAVSLTEAVNAIEAQYQSANPGITFVNNYDASGTLLNEIQAGAQVDIFISAAVDQIDVLDSQGKLTPGTRQNIVTNQLVLVTPTTPPISAGSANLTSFNGLTDSSITGIAIGDPATVPAGKYSTELFQTRGIYNAIQSKLVLASNVRNVLNAVANKTINGQTIDAGVVYKTDAQTTSTVQLIDSSQSGDTDPIVYPAAVLASSTNQDAAAAFTSYLTSTDAQDVFRGAGFLPPP